MCRADHLPGLTVAASLLLAVLAPSAPAAWPVSGSAAAGGSAAPLPPAPGPVSVVVTSCGGLSVTVRVSWPGVQGATAYDVTLATAGQPASTTRTSVPALDVVNALGALTSVRVTSVTGTWVGPAGGAVALPATC